MDPKHRKRLFRRGGRAPNATGAVLSVFFQGFRYFRPYNSQRLPCVAEGCQGLDAVRFCAQEARHTVAAAPDRGDDWRTEAAQKHPKGAGAEGPFNQAAG